MESRCLHQPQGGMVAIWPQTMQYWARRISCFPCWKIFEVSTQLGPDEKNFVSLYKLTAYMFGSAVPRQKLRCRWLPFKHPPLLRTDLPLSAAIGNGVMPSHPWPTDSTGFSCCYRCIYSKVPVSRRVSSIKRHVKKLPLKLPATVVTYFIVVQYKKNMTVFVLFIRGISQPHVSGRLHCLLSPREGG